MKRASRRFVAIAVALAAVACNQERAALKSAPAASEAALEAIPDRVARAEQKVAMPKKRAVADELLDSIGNQGIVGGLGSGRAAGSLAGIRGAAPPPAAAPATPAERESAGGEEGGVEEAPTRAWFPETFLFTPLVVTDAGGAAQVPVRVPDRLTSWRVLALAHSRAGAQAGAETTFEGTLPVYVDPVMPAFLVAGDEVSLPIQVVNTTDEAVTAPLQVTVSGGALARAVGAVRVEAGGSVVVHAPVRANTPGKIALRAALAGSDAVERSAPVRPRGRPVGTQRGGTLAAERSMELALPADTYREGATARLQVYPGALAILRAELASAGARGDAGGDAYALLLAGRGEALLEALGGEPENQALRALGIVAGQRVIRAARSPDALTAAMFAEAALAHPGNPVLSRLGERLAATVAAGQRPDGTCAGADGWPLQRLLAATADCVRAVRATSATGPARQRAQRVTLAARRAFERNLERIEDPYTAATILASGALDGAARDRLRRRVREGIKRQPDGTQALAVEAAIVRADGLPPPPVEATAMAVLALRDDQSAAALVADLGGRLLSGYDPARGFGDGRTNLAALTAVLSLFKEPLPARVTITLTQDGRSLAEQVLEGPKLREVLVLETPLPDPASRHTYVVRADPAVPGLGYALALGGFVPWGPDRAEGGLELTVGTPREARVGQPIDVDVRAAAPAGLELTVRHGLPAGVQVDTASLDALVTAGTIRSYQREDGAVTLKVPARTPGQTFAARYRAIPTLAGRIGGTPSAISAGGATHHVAPSSLLVR
jgi:hypothetical protein